MAKKSLFPQKADVDERKLASLTKTFKNTYKDIFREILTATDFGVTNRRAILAQIEVILADLGVDVQEFIEKEIPAAYTVGANQAGKQLRLVGADVPISRGFNVINRDAIAALVDDTSLSFAESLQGINRSAGRLLGKATRDLLTEQMAKGVIRGDALRTVRQQIKGILQEQGLAAIVDTAGRKWSLDRYAETLFRTKIVEARNRGMANRMVENGYDLVQVSSHDTQHTGPRGCARWEKKILSITGQTKGYPTLAEAEQAGLFHPNCKHAINVLIPSLARKTKAYDRTTKGFSEPGSTVPGLTNN